MSGRLTGLGAAAGALLLAACAAPAARQSSVTGGVAAPVSLAGVTISLERRPCYGGCPVYRMTLTGEGVVRWQGERFVEREGSDSATVPVAGVRLLLDNFAALGFDTLPARYVRGEAACGLYHTDVPTVVTTLTRDGQTHRVEHDYGCADAPAALGALEQRIDSVAGTARWIGPR